MVAHFEVPRAECRMTARKLALALNAWLPEDIRVLSAARARQDFHARFDAAGKQYRYFVWNHPAMNPLLRHTAWHVPRPLDLRGHARAPRRSSWAGTTSSPSPPIRATPRRPPSAP